MEKREKHHRDKERKLTEIKGIRERKHHKDGEKKSKDKGI